MNAREILFAQATHVRSWVPEAVFIDYYACFCGAPTPDNNAHPGFADKLLVIRVLGLGLNTIASVGFYTSSPGDEHRQGEGLRGPVQWRRECKTLYEIPLYLHIVYGIDCERKSLELR